MSLVVAGSQLPQIRQYLLGLFGPELGRYILPDGSTRPAIYVVGPRQVRPDWRVEGIECLLINPPMISDLGSACGPLKAARMWTLKFVCFDTEKTLEAIQLLAYRAWPEASPRPLPQTDDTYEQLTYELFDPVLIQPL